MLQNRKLQSGTVSPLISLYIIHDKSEHKFRDVHKCSFYKRKNGKKQLIYSKKHPEKGHTITERESVVLPLLGKGLSTEEIAASLYISVDTVKTHRKNILSKLNAKNIAEAIKIAFAYDLC